VRDLQGDGQLASRTDEWHDAALSRDAAAVILNRVVYLQDLDRTFAALADPTRRAMIAELTGGPRTITALAQPHAMSLVAASKHVTVLERAGLLRRERVGRSQVCTLRREALDDAGGWIERHRAFWTTRLDALAEHLTATGPTEKP
jgi:DNA-binding transcriptional ArsR family regulator